jgi:hypothetical protein
MSVGGTISADGLDEAKPSIFCVNPIALALRQPVVAIEIGFYVLHCAAHRQKRADGAVDGYEKD